MPHDHGHHHVDPKTGDARVGWAILVNIALTLAQIIGGVLSGSLALIADALHNLSDAIALVIAFAARRIARRPVDPAMTYGYGRAEPVAALINYTTLIVVAIYLMVEAVGRMFAPEPIDGWIVVWIAAIALVIDLVTAALTWSMARDSMNIRAAFLHNVADALGSVGVIVAGALVIWFDWVWVDPVVTLMISVYILAHVWSEIGGVIRLLMLGSPPELDTGAVIDALRSTPGVADIHHVHLWQMQEREPALQAHVVLEPGRWSDADAIKADLKAMLSARFDIAHSTLELECAAHACPDGQVIGH
ncbi:MAG: cation diffusion facilitator family transporter [Marinibacterium sp.]|nr:cation diffusion facilitator family transporter [Marinibacterium sp.]